MLIWPPEGTVMGGARPVKGLDYLIDTAHVARLPVLR